MNNSNYITIGLIAIVIIATLLISINRRPKMRYGEILPADEMKAKYNSTAESSTPKKLAPENLRDLLPLALKWGIGDDIIRDDFVQKAPENEKQELKNLLTGRTAEVTKWLDSFEVSKPMFDEAACFMYMLKALDEMKLWPNN